MGGGGKHCGKDRLFIWEIFIFVHLESCRRGDSTFGKNYIWEVATWENTLWEVDAWEDVLWKIFNIMQIMKTRQKENH